MSQINNNMYDRSVIRYFFKNMHGITPHKYTVDLKKHSKDKNKLINILLKKNDHNRQELIKSLKAREMRQKTQLLYDINRDKSILKFMNKQHNDLLNISFDYSNHEVPFIYQTKPKNRPSILSSFEIF